MDAWKWAVAGAATAITMTMPVGATGAPAGRTPDRLIELRGGDFHAVVWRQGKLIDINRTGDNSEAAAVNNRGQVAGLTQPARTDQAARRQPFRWQSGWTKLYTPLPSAADVSIVGLDAQGRIAVSVITNDQALILRSA